MAIKSVDVAIVGGGVIGWSCAWHLLKREPKLNLLVIDPDPTRGTSLRGAGGVRSLFASQINIELSLLSIEKFKVFADCVGTDVRFRQHGYLLYTADVEGAERMQQVAEFQRSHGVAIEDLDVAELKARVPCLNTGDLVYAQFGPTCGYLDGPGVMRGYRSASMKVGAIELMAKATSVAKDRVNTSHGEVAAKQVVLAAGHWSSNFGLDIAVRPEKHQLCYAMPDKVDTHWPFVIDADTSYHFRPYGDGVLVCYNDPLLASEKHLADDDPDFNEPVIERLLKLAGHRTPGFLTHRNCSPGRAGFYGVTPDRHPVIGKLEGVYIATGFGGHGIMQSPATGQLMAELMLDGTATTLEIKSLSPSRFRKGRLIQETMVF